MAFQDLLMQSFPVLTQLLPCNCDKHLWYLTPPISFPSLRSEAAAKNMLFFQGHVLGGALLLWWKLKTLPECQTVFLHLYWAFTVSGLLKWIKAAQRLHTAHNNHIFGAGVCGKSCNAQNTIIPANHHWYFLKNDAFALLGGKVPVWPPYSNDTDIAHSFNMNSGEHFFFFLLLLPQFFTNRAVILENRCKSIQTKLH